MATYVLAYKGGRMPETDAERDAQMAAWGGWFQNLGAAVVDAGNPFGPSRAVNGDGTISDGAPSALTGYTILTSDSIDAAAKLATGCPILSNGGSLEVYETFEVM